MLIIALAGEEYEMTKKKEIVKAVKYEDSDKKIRVTDESLEYEFEHTNENINKAYQRMSGINDEQASNELIGCAAASSSKIATNETTTLNVTFSLLEDIGPQDALEGMLATQMVACHNMAMEMAKRAMHTQHSPEVASQCVTRATKLMNTFSNQISTLQKYRNKGQHTIQVQHVNVEAGGQAIVGNVNRGKDDG